MGWASSGSSAMAQPMIRPAKKHLTVEAEALDVLHLVEIQLRNANRRATGHSH